MTSDDMSRITMAMAAGRAPSMEDARLLLVEIDRLRMLLADACELAAVRGVALAAATAETERIAAAWRDEHHGCPNDCGVCDAMVALAPRRIALGETFDSQPGHPAAGGAYVAATRPFHVGAEVEVRVLPITHDRVEWERATITGGPQPHPSGDCVTWGVDAAGTYRFEDEMRWPEEAPEAFVARAVTEAEENPSDGGADSRQTGTAAPDHGGRGKGGG